MTGPYLMHVASPEVVRDIEAIRAGLRDGKLNWLGLSYGTMLGGMYAERYPKRIRTLALDGALDRGLSEPGMLGAEATAAEDGFERWAAWCTTSPECPLQGQDVLRIWDDLIAAANRSPIPASNVGRGVTGEEIQNNTNSNYLLFTRPNAFAQMSWLSIGPAIVKALNGDASDFATQIGGRRPTPPTGNGRSSASSSRSRRAASPSSWEERELRASSRPTWVARTRPGESSPTASAGHARRNPRHFLDIEGAPPSLIVNATHDPLHLIRVGAQHAGPDPAQRAANQGRRRSHLLPELVVCAGGDRPLPDRARAARPRDSVPRLTVV